MSMMHGMYLRPMDRMTDRCLWKHYLPTTTIAGSDKIQPSRSELNKSPHRQLYVIVMQ